MLAVHLFGRWSLRGELLVSGKGGAYSRGPDGTANLYYLVLPLLMEAAFPVARAVEVRAGGGMAIGYRLAGALRDGRRSSDLMADTTDLDLGALLNVGAGWTPGHGALTLDVRYEIGLRDVSRGNGRRLADGLHNSTLSVLVGLVF
jgi:hypothetical protein